MSIQASRIPLLAAVALAVVGSHCTVKVKRDPQPDKPSQTEVPAPQTAAETDAQEAALAEVLEDPTLAPTLIQVPVEQTIATMDSDEDNQILELRVNTDASQTDSQTTVVDGVTKTQNCAADPITGEVRVDIAEKGNVLVDIKKLGNLVINRHKINLNFDRNSVNSWMRDNFKLECDAKNKFLNLKLADLKGLVHIRKRGGTDTRQFEISEGSADFKNLVGHLNGKKVVTSFNGEERTEYVDVDANASGNEIKTTVLRDFKIKFDRKTFIANGSTRLLAHDVQSQPDGKLTIVTHRDKDTKQWKRKEIQSGSVMSKIAGGQVKLDYKNVRLKRERSCVIDAGGQILATVVNPKGEVVRKAKLDFTMDRSYITWMDSAGKTLEKYDFELPTCPVNDRKG